MCYRERWNSKTVHMENLVINKTSNFSDANGHNIKDVWQRGKTLHGGKEKKPENRSILRL
jgi:hypothetical protein